MVELRGLPPTDRSLISSSSLKEGILKPWSATVALRVRDAERAARPPPTPGRKGEAPLRSAAGRARAVPGGRLGEGFPFAARGDGRRRRGPGRRRRGARVRAQALRARRAARLPPPRPRRALRRRRRAAARDRMQRVAAVALDGGAADRRGPRGLLRRPRGPDRGRVVRARVPVPPRDGEARARRRRATSPGARDDRTRRRSTPRTWSATS